MKLSASRVPARSLLLEEVRVDQPYVRMYQEYHSHLTNNGLKELRRPKVDQQLINWLIPRSNSNRPKVDEQVDFAINLWINS